MSEAGWARFVDQEWERAEASYIEDLHDAWLAEQIEKDRAAGKPTWHECHHCNGVGCEVCEDAGGWYNGGGA